MELDDRVCYCFHVSKRKIVNFILRERPQRASMISNCLSAGTGCGWCVPMIKRMHRELLDHGEIREADQVSATDYEAMRRAYLKRGKKHLDDGA
jgi:NAD(P)H-nitrite reductase large subunit